MNVSFNDELATDLANLVPPRKRNRFVVAAVLEKMDRVRQEAAVRAAAGAWSDHGRGDPSRDVRQMREEWRKRGTRTRGGEAGDG